MLLSSSTASLQSAKLSELKQIAKSLGITPSGDKRRKATWIAAIQASQEVQEVKVSYEENLARLEQWGRDFESFESTLDRLHAMIQGSREASALAARALDSLEETKRRLDALAEGTLAKHPLL